MTAPESKWLTFSVEAQDAWLNRGLPPVQIDLQVCAHCRTTYTVLINDPRSICTVCVLTDQLLMLAQGLRRLIDDASPRP